MCHGTHGQPQPIHMSIKHWLLHSPSMWHAGSARTVAQLAEKGNLGLGRGMHADRHCNDTHFSTGGCKQCLKKARPPCNSYQTCVLKAAPLGLQFCIASPIAKVGIIASPIALQDLPTYRPTDPPTYLPTDLPTYSQTGVIALI
jgi:hypothetical protein